MAHTLLIVGGGKMGSALLGGLLASGWVAPGQVAVAETSPPRRHELTAAFPGVRVIDAPEPPDETTDGRAGTVLAVKPDVAEGACRVLGAVGVRRLLSIVAGIPSLRLETALGGQPSVVRAMPNTPALVRAGVTALSGGSHATSADLDWAEGVMGAVGTVIRLPERLLDPVTGLSGSGPAYFFLVAEALIEAGVQMGLTRDVSRTLVVETMRGSATLLAESGEDPAVLRAGVTSPAGTTAAGIRALEARAVRSAFMEAVAAATERSRARCIVERMTVFFLSDYGTEDEFVGVVHAVLTAASPGLTIIDLTHHVPAFDVRAGSHTLVRASPHLGPGVVLAVVDPGVGSARRGLCLPVTPPGNGPTFFVGPDNGLLVAAAEQVGEAPITRAFELRRPADVADRGRSFDGRDLFAPAAAALCGGVAPEELADPIEPRSLVRLPGGVVEQGRRNDGRRCLRAEVLWIDHFGNIQLAATAAHAQMAELPRTGTVDVDLDVPDPLPGRTVRRVETFAELEPGELGLLIDANGHLAVVAGEAPAAPVLTVVAGQMMVLTW